MTTNLKLLCVFAHPDDESLETLLKAIRQGWSALSKPSLRVSWKVCVESNPLTYKSSGWPRSCRHPDTKASSCSF